ncbi:MAG: AAA family ATPase [Leptospiraceae bacterium]|nr:AAA family ATPase [Leptospiraceae bacterium]MCP5500338.1 AAA family ATPase [Leptospiraceae bacterium]
MGLEKETITLSEAKRLIKAMAAKESILILSAPGVGKSDVVRQAAKEEGLEVRSLLGTQIAPEDVSGIPRIVNERSVFCPPRILLPEDPKPFCLFLDEFPAAAPDVQKALYALLLERRLGEHKLPEGTWVVAAGNRQEDRALVRQMSSALVNRTFVLQIKVDVKEWIDWAEKSGIHPDILAFIKFMPDALMRPVPDKPVPFSTPRAWASLSNAIHLCSKSGKIDLPLLRSLAFGRVSAEDAAIFSTIYENELTEIFAIEEYIKSLDKLPHDSTKLWMILHSIRRALEDDKLKGFSVEELENFLQSIPTDNLFTLLSGNVDKWGSLGLNDFLKKTLEEVTGIGE